MKKVKIMIALVTAFATGLLVEIVPGANGTFESGVSAKISEAAAQYGQSRRVARRTARRTTRRVNYRQSVAGCSPYRAYFNCSGVYYQPVIQDGVTVYIVVNP